MIGKIFWYAISNVKDRRCRSKSRKKDGTLEIIEEIDQEMLKDWDK